MASAHPSVPDAARTMGFAVYEDVELIGAGPRATVHRARETGTGRLVALKSRRVEDAQDARALDRLGVTLVAVSTHPNLVTVHRGFLAADGRHVLALELCPGTLADRVEPGHGLPAHEVVATGIRVAGALASAHHVGLLHGAITPWNVMVTRFGEPALAELGVAPVARPDRPWTGDARTAALVAPEILRAADTSAGTDVYGLAATLHWLLDGRGPIRVRDDDSVAAVAARVLRDPVAPLIDPRVPTSLARLLGDALQKDPARRPADAEDFALRLAEIEAEQGWARTPMLVRDPDCGIGLELPVVPAVALRPSTSTRPRRRQRPAPSLAPPPPPSVVEGEDDTALFTRLLSVAEARPRPYPLPPTMTPDRPASDAVHAVPTWSSRPVTRDEGHDEHDHDDGWGRQGRDEQARSRDPMTLPPTTTIRAGRSHVLVATVATLQLRDGLRRCTIPWSSVRGLVRRFDDRVGGIGSRGVVVALTTDGPVELLATRGSPPHLAELLAFLDACRERALIAAGR